MAKLEKVLKNAKVLILVCVEDSVGVFNFNILFYGKGVLILVCVEDSVGECSKYSYSEKSMRS